MSSPDYTSELNALAAALVADGYNPKPRPWLARLLYWMGHPFRSCARGCGMLLNLTQTQIRALFSLGMLGGIIALSMQNIGLIVMVRRALNDAPAGSLFGAMALNQQWWNNAIMAGFGVILGLVVFGADYFRAKVNQKEIEFGNGPAPQSAPPPPPPTEGAPQ